MDPFAALKSEIFRPLATVVIPGLLAVAPSAAVLCIESNHLLSFYKSQTTWFMVALVIVSTAVGMLMENIGSSIERGIDRCMDVEYQAGHSEVWVAYLSCGVVDNNGRRFLGSIVTRLKFINSMIPALVAFSVGMWLLLQRLADLSVAAIAMLLFVMASILTWLFRTSTELSEVASNTRFCLLPLDKRPASYNADAISVRRWRHFAYVVGELVTSRGFEIDLRGKLAVAVLLESWRIFWGVKRGRRVIPSPWNDCE